MEANLFAEKILAIETQKEVLDVAEELGGTRESWIKDAMKVSWCCAIATYQENPAKFLSRVTMCIDSVVKSIDESATQFLLAKVKGSVFKQKTLVCAVRGSITFDDWKTNFTFVGNPLYEGKMHSGFFKRSGDIPVEPFLILLAQGYDVIFTGHSLGAAVAKLVLIRLLNEPRFQDHWLEKISFIGFATPLVGDKTFIERRINQGYRGKLKVRDRFFSVINNRDIVPRLLLLCDKVVIDAILQVLKWVNGVALSTPSVPQTIQEALSTVFGFIKSKFVEEENNTKPTVDDMIKKEISGMLLPNYWPGGHYYFIGYDFNIHKLDSGIADDQATLLDHFLSWKGPDNELDLQLNHITQHLASSYTNALRSACLEPFSYNYFETLRYGTILDNSGFFDPSIQSYDIFFNAYTNTTTGELRGSNLSWLRLDLDDDEWKCINDSLITLHSASLKPKERKSSLVLSWGPKVSFIEISAKSLLSGWSEEIICDYKLQKSDPGPKSLDIWTVPRAFAAHVLFLSSSDLESVKKEMEIWGKTLIDFEENMKISDHLNSEYLGICARLMAYLVIHNVEWDPKHLFVMAQYPQFFLERNKKLQRIKQNISAYSSQSDVDKVLKAAVSAYVRIMKEEHEPGVEVTLNSYTFSSLLLEDEQKKNLEKAISKALKSEDEPALWKSYYGIETGDVNPASTKSTLPPLVCFKKAFKAAKKPSNHRLSLFYSILPISCYFMLVQQSLHMKLNIPRIFGFVSTLELNQLTYESRLILITEALIGKKYECPVIYDVEDDLVKFTEENPDLDETLYPLAVSRTLFIFVDEKVTTRRLKKLKEFIATVVLAHEVRDLLAKHHLMISCGTQNAGKSTIMKTVMGGGKRIEAFGHKNTRDGTLVSLNKTDHIIDLPAYNDQCEVRNGLTRLMMQLASSAIAVMPVADSNDASSQDFLQMLHSVTRNNPYPVLTVLSKADNLYDSVYKDTQNQKNSVQQLSGRARRRLANCEKDTNVGRATVETSAVNVDFWNRVKQLYSEIQSNSPQLRFGKVVLACVSPDDPTKFPREFLSSYDNEDFWMEIDEENMFGELQQEELSTKVFGILGLMALVWHLLAEHFSDSNDEFRKHILDVVEDEDCFIHNFFQIFRDK